MCQYEEQSSPLTLIFSAVFFPSSAIRLVSSTMREIFLAFSPEMSTHSTDTTDFFFLFFWDGGWVEEIKQISENKEEIKGFYCLKQ